MAAAAWLLVLGLWGAGLAWLRHDWPRLAANRHAKPDAEVEAWFSEAQTEYLRGHWLEAETLISRVLARQPADVEARLLRASIQRRTNRTAAARTTLDELKESGRATEWLLEIESELERLNESENKRNQIPGRVEADQEPRRAA
jgi:predicted Zn-dependent protease